MLRTLVLRLVLGGVIAAMTAGEPDYDTQEIQPGNYIQRVKAADRYREYRLHVPAHYDGSRKLPVMFMFHEIAFVNAMIDQLSTRLMVDSTRMYAAGYSDGGTLSYIIGCTMPHRIAAVAGISGTLFEPQPKCALPHPVPAMIVHGTADLQIPYLGDKGGPPNVKGNHFTYSASAVTQFWVRQDKCHTSPDSVKTGQVIRVRYVCPDSAEVVFYTIDGGKHGWPGGGRGWIFSPEPPKDMIATDTVVQFFLRHRQPR